MNIGAVMVMLMAMVVKIHPVYTQQLDKDISLVDNTGENISLRVVKNAMVEKTVVESVVLESVAEESVLEETVVEKNVLEAVAEEGVAVVRRVLESVVEVEGPAGDVVLVPEKLMKVVQGSEHGVTWYSTLPQLTSVSATVEDKGYIILIWAYHLYPQMVAEVTEVSEVMRGTSDDDFNYYGHINISTLFIGYDTVYVTLYDRFNVVAGEAVLEMSVVLPSQQANEAFTSALGFVVVLPCLLLGLRLDLQAIQGITIKPVGPVVGICCQFLFMPLISFALGKIAFHSDTLAQLGLFLLGCCPGGSGSNLWTHLLGGSLDLSVLMTICSTLLAFGALPLWVSLLGRRIVQGTSFVIPYVKLTIVLLLLVVPCVAGYFIQRFLPKVTTVLKKLITPAIIICILLVFMLGVYANYYLLAFFSAKHLSIYLLSVPLSQSPLSTSPSISSQHLSIYLFSSPLKISNFVSPLSPLTTSHSTVPYLLSTPPNPCISSQHFLTGLALPVLGYLSGLGLSSAYRLPWKDRIAISIETGLQNGTLVYVMLQTSLEQPAADLAVLEPTITLLMAQVPLAIAFIVRLVYLRIHPIKDTNDEGWEELQEVNDNEK
ncbi:hypothetical protein Pcinc_003221 [Petrolisthes cinctipes]|uniref:Uncharacterized protein n=1 Tax=Petrolisthes cinctipes TaxID=88211 RepID=A0AAE1GP05_PETCI|nr:hypothetical protein Pcinc_003221 [Petrolisthes cinctipes]